MKMLRCFSCTMTKLAAILIAILALQGASAKYDDDFRFINLWNEIELEIKDLILHLKNDNGEDTSYLNALTRRCLDLGVVIKNIIDQLHQETIDHEQGDIIFKRVMYVFRQVHSSLTLFPKNLSPVQIKSKLIYSLDAVIEHMEQLVFIAKTYCPQLRALLRTILIDFLNFVRAFRTKDGILEKDVVIYESPQRMLAQIKVITKQVADFLSECNHVEEMRAVLRGYVRYVEEIIHKLEDQVLLSKITVLQTFYDEDVVKAALQRLVDELRGVFVPLMKMFLNEVHVDVKTFRTDLIARFLTINSALEQLVKLDNNNKKTTDFIERIIYFYYYTIKQTHYETRTARKNSFYGANYHEEFFVNDHQEVSVFDPENFDIASPEELLMRIQQLVRRFDGVNWDAKPVVYFARDLVQVLEHVADKVAKEVRIHRLASAQGVIMDAFYADLKKMKLQLEDTLAKDQAVKDEFVESVRKVFVDLYKIVIVEKTNDNGYEHLLLKDICIEFYNYLNDLFYKMDIYDDRDKVIDGLSDEQKPKFVLIKLIQY